MIPEHIRELQNTVQVTICDEGEFLRTAPTAEWDFIVSDGDYFRAHEHVKDYRRILRRGGILAIHDTKNSEFPNLGTIREQLDGFMKMEFSESTRDDEQCERGLLIGKKPEDAPANSGRTFGRGGVSPCIRAGARIDIPRIPSRILSCRVAFASYFLERSIM